MKRLLRSGCVSLVGALLLLVGVPHGAAASAPASTLEAINYLGMLEVQGNLVTALRKLGIATSESAYPLGAVVTDHGYATAVATTSGGEPLIRSEASQRLGA